MNVHDSHHFTTVPGVILLLLGVVLAGCQLPGTTTTAATTPQLQCPPFLHEAGREQSLAAWEFLRGDPSQRDVLFADFEELGLGYANYRWELSRYRDERLTLSCRYVNTFTAITIPVPDDLATCSSSAVVDDLAWVISPLPLDCN